MAVISIANALTTGASAAYEFDGGLSQPGAYSPTVHTVCVYGTFGGATLQHQISPDGGTTWIAIDATNAQATAAKAYNIEARQDATYRVSIISGATTGTSINAKAFI